MSTPPDGRQPVMLVCRPCGLEWVGAYLPMPMSTFARLLKGAACPRCGEREHVYLRQPGSAAAQTTTTEERPTP